MVNLASRDSPCPATKHEIANSEDMSADYVEQIMMRLKAANLVRSHRGRNGGFSLARPPDAITLADVLQATEGRISPIPCLAYKCSRAPNCPTRPIWKRAAEALEELFEETTIAQIAKDAALCRATEVLAYEI